MRLLEGRILVTTDHDFGNVLHYPPTRTPGIAVLNPAGPSTAAAIAQLVRVLISTLASRPITGRLWIVEAARVREPSETAGDGLVFREDS